MLVKALLCLAERFPRNRCVVINALLKHGKSAFQNNTNPIFHQGDRAGTEHRGNRG
jgi:hypothetical protein